MKNFRSVNLKTRIKCTILMKILIYNTGLGIIRKFSQKLLENVTLFND